jgi:prephenate dehydratase
VLIERVPTLGDVRYFPTMDEVWDSIAMGAVDSGILTADSTHTGLSEIASYLLDPDRRFYVNGEGVIPYHCMLLAKPGTTMDRIKRVLGHGSLAQCREFLAERLPSADVRMHEQNSLSAAQEVLSGDGDLAVVGTELSAQKNGLAILERDIDRGSVGAWWVLSRELHEVPQPDVVVVGVSSSKPESLTDLLVRMRELNLSPRGIAARNAGAVFRYDYLAVFAGNRLSRPASEVLDGLPGCRLLGAFESIVG